MKKRLSKFIAAAACAVMMASQMAAFSVSAADPTGAYYYYYNGVFYSYDTDATSAAGGNAGAWQAVPSDRIPANATKKFYDPSTKMIYETEAAAVAAGVSNVRVIYVGSYTGSSVTGYGRWYSSYTGKTYTSYQDALNASLGNAAYVTYVNSYGYDYRGYGWYSSYTGKTYSTYQAALEASRGISSYVTYVGGYYGYDGQAGSIYRYYYNGVAYPTLDAAIAAGGTAGVDIYYSPIGSEGKTYYYYYNGTYYGSLQAAINAGGTAVGVDISYVPYGYYGKDYGYAYYYNYYNPYYYYTNGSLIDPYSAFRKVITSTNTTKTETKAAEPGEPFIYGNNKRAGWDTIVTYVKAASGGTNIKVDMNGCNIIDKSVLTALSGRNVSVTFVLDNGVKWTINGKKVSSAQDIICYTEYDINYITPSLVKKAGDGAVTKAQIGVSTNFEEFGSDVSVTVRFSDKRAGLNATVYLFNPDTNSLKGVAKAKVQADGSCTFTAKAGGPYLIVLK